MYFRSLLYVLQFWVSVFYLFSSQHVFAAEARKLPEISYITSGTARFPHSLQPSEEDNAYFESFFKASIPVWKADKAKLSLFLRGFFSSDSQRLSFNNRAKVSVGVSYSRKLTKKLRASLDVQYDVDNRYTTHETQSGWRAKASYSYYSNIWRNRPKNHKGWFRQNSWVQTWGVLTFPESLAAGNDNLAFLSGGEVATAFVRPNSKLQYVPFVDLIVGKDSYQLSFNSKAVLGAGFKLRKPIKGGQITLGVKYAFDRRWTLGTTQSGAVVFSGWYKSF